jgi:uncharacterized protein YuzE
LFEGFLVWVIILDSAGLFLLFLTPKREKILKKGGTHIMEMKVVGLSERRAGMSKSTGKPYDGTTLHCLRSRSKDVIEGQAVKEIYLNHLAPVTFPTIAVGDVIKVEFDDKGFIEGIEVVKAAANNPFAPAPVAKAAKSAE